MRFGSKPPGPRPRGSAWTLGDPSFVHRLKPGREPRLGTADRVLAFMAEAPLDNVFRHEVEAFLEVTRTQPRMRGMEAVGDPSTM